MFQLAKKALNILTLLLMTAGGASAFSSIRLDLDRQAINRNAGFNQRDFNVYILVKQFNLTPSQVESRLAQGEDWGQVAIRLALAWELVQEDNNRYPGIVEALPVTDGISFTKKSWADDAAKIANLSPVAITVADLARQFAQPHPFKGEIIFPKNTIPPANPIGSSGLTERGTAAGDSLPRVQAPRR